ncbi:MAG: hypothetical protein PUC00_02250 [Clostridiales bacterium]|nr:hypothetical protein [Clostridiales bacterium]
MGQFANTLFQLMMGWVQTAVAWLWALFTQSDASGWLRWLSEHWLPLLVGLCIAGVVIDFIVYLVRWQPYRVWRSFLHRLSGREKAEDADVPAPQRTWIYADGSTAVEHLQEARMQSPTAQPQLNAPVRPMRRTARDIPMGEAYHQPVYPPQWQHTRKQGGQE